MASPENPMSGDRVDVLSVIKAMDSALDDANTGPPGAICVRAICRIEELIKAAEELLADHDRWLDEGVIASTVGTRTDKARKRLAAALRACRQGDEK
jgi:hypothetical protein